MFNSFNRFPLTNILDTEDYNLVDEFSGYVLLERDGDGNSKLHPDLTLLMTTSGTTASRKVVRLTKKNMVSNAQSITSYLDIKMDDRAITTMPMSYSYMLSIINSHLLKGASIILTDATLMDRIFWNEIRKNNTQKFS